MPARESAIIVPVRLPGALSAIRHRETVDGPLGVPGHVTLLYPFVPPGRIDARVEATVARIIGAAQPFDPWFREIRRWERSDGAPGGVVWVAPEPAAPFIDLTLALCRAFPEHPPFGGAYDTVIPHLTLAALDERRQAAIEAEALPWLPFRRRVSAATLIVEGLDGRWRTRRRFPLGVAVAGRV